MCNECCDCGQSSPEHLEEKIEVLEIEIENLNETIDDLRDTIQELETTIDGLEEDLEFTSDEKDSLSYKVTELNEDIETLSDRIHELEFQDVLDGDDRKEISRKIIKELEYNLLQDDRFLEGWDSLESLIEEELRKFREVKYGV